MNEESIYIKESKQNNNKIEEFEKKEWHLADLEHYGKDVDLKKTNYKFIAQNNSGAIIGTLDLMIEANLAFVEGLLVSSKHRNMGIGKKLLTHAEKFAKKKHCTKIWLETNENWRATEFYKKNKYKVTGIHEKHILNQKTLILTKYL